MPQIGNSLHGVNLTANIAKDFSTGKSGSVGQAERKPFESGTAKFSTSKLSRIKFGTIGRPEARATKITHKALSTASRALGEMLGSIGKGRLAEANDWLTQAGENLEPMLRHSNLGHAKELQGGNASKAEVQDHVMNLRLSRHLQQMSGTDLVKIAGELANAADNTLANHQPLIKSAVLAELKSRNAQEYRNLRGELAQNSGDRAWLAGKFDVGARLVADYITAAGKLEGKGVASKEVLAADTRFYLLLQVASHDDAEGRTAVHHLNDTMLLSVASLAGDMYPLGDMVKSEITARVEELQKDFTSALEPFATLDAQRQSEALLEARESLQTLLDFAGAVEKAVPELGLKQTMLADAQEVVKGFYKQLGEIPEFVSGLSTGHLDAVLSLGETAGVKPAATLSAPAKAFMDQVREVGAARFAAGYEKLKAVGAQVQQALNQNALDLAGLNDLYRDFSGPCVDLYADNRLLDRSLQADADGGMTVADYPTRVLDHMIHSPNNDGKAQAQDFLSSQRSADSILSLDYRNTDLAPETKALKEALLNDLNRLRQDISERYQKDRTNLTAKNNLDLVDALLWERKSGLAQQLRDNHATEAALVLMTDPSFGSDAARGKTAQFYLGFLAIQGLSGIRESFVAIDRQDVSTHTVTLPPHLASLQPDLDQVRAHAVATSQARRYIQADEVLKASPHAQTFLA